MGKGPASDYAKLRASEPLRPVRVLPFQHWVRPSDDLNVMVMPHEHDDPDRVCSIDTRPGWTRWKGDHAKADLLDAGRFLYCGRVPGDPTRATVVRDLLVSRLTTLAAARDQGTADVLQRLAVAVRDELEDDDDDLHFLADVLDYEGGEPKSTTPDFLDVGNWAMYVQLGPATVEYMENISTTQDPQAFVRALTALEAEQYIAAMTFYASQSAARRDGNR